MNKIQLLIPDLLSLPELLSPRAGLQLPALRMWLARARVEPLAETTLEGWLCDAFGVSAIAATTLQAEGLAPDASHWMRADPVHLRIVHDKLILEPVSLSADEAQQFVASLNAHFAADGLIFSAPHPRRWYLATPDAPRIATRHFSSVENADVRNRLPDGEDAGHWHRMLNEMQMLLHTHPLNEAREARGELPVNSVWLWGEGSASGALRRPCAGASGDSELARMFAQLAGVPWLTRDEALAATGDVLFVWEGLGRAARRGDLNAWRAEVEALEQDCIAPLLASLRAGKVGQVVLDVPQAEGARRFGLSRGDLWKFWRRFPSP
ncbi:MAG: hypothetical protein LBE50_04165 [Gallionellaceae bacterium]|jgi:hypothetical protein|nr:hypothetical protein [Gallionellaceae bacterium]